MREVELMMKPPEVASRFVVLRCPECGHMGTVRAVMLDDPERSPQCGSCGSTSVPAMMTSAQTPDQQRREP